MPRAADLLADELNNRALSLLDLGRIAEAADAFAAAQEADPRHLEATYNDGLRRWRSGDITDDLLIGRIEAARTASGDSWLARYLLAEVHLERGDLTAARELLRTVEGIAPEQPSVANALRIVRSGQLAGARRAKTRVMRWHEYEGDGIPPIRIRFTTDGRRALALSGKNLGLWDVHNGQCLVRLTGEHDPHTYVDISGDGLFALWGRDFRVGLRDLTSGRELWRARTGAKSYEWINAVSLSADARIAATVLSTVVTSSDRKNVMIWDARSGRLRVRLGEHSGVIRAELSPDGRFALTSGREDHTARLWDTGTGACVRELHRGDWNVSAMSISPDARTAAIALKDIDIWDLTTGRQIRTLTGHTRVVRSLSWSRDGQFLLSAADYDNVRLWEAHSGRCLSNFPYTGTWGLSYPTLLLAPEDGSPVVADGEAVRWWPLPSRYSAPPQLSRPRRHAELARMATDANALAESAEQAITAHRYSEAHGLLIRARAIPGYERDPRMLSAWRSLTSVLPRVGVRASWQVREFDSEYHGAIDLSPDGARAVSSDLYTLRVWDTRTGRCLRTINHPSMVTAVRLSPDQRWVASAAFCGQIGVWSIDNGDCLMKIASRQNDNAKWTHFNADGRWALCDAYDSIRLWDLGSGQCVRTVGCHDRISSVSLTPDGGRAVAGTGDHTVRIWDMGTGECLHTLVGHTGRIGVVSVSPEGDLAVSGDDEKTVRVWDLGSGDCMHVLRDLPDRLWSVRLVCNGRFVMTGGVRGTIQIWDSRTGRCLHTFNSGRTEVRVAPTPDCRFALSHGGDVPLRLWEFDWELAASST
jgi:WD40 repeat protein